MISGDEKGTVFLVNLKLEGSRLNKDIKKGNFRKDLMNLIDTIYQINIISDYFFSVINLFNKHLNAFSTFLTLYQFFVAQWFCFSVCRKGDVSSALGENWQEPSSSTILTEAAFNGDSNEETLNVNEICWK